MEERGVAHADYLFSIPPFVPTLRSLNYVGDWNSLVTQVNNLTSFVFDLDSMPSKINTEAFRLLMCNNRSLESLELRLVDLEGDSKGPPVRLLNLKSLIVDSPSQKAFDHHSHPSVSTFLVTSNFTRGRYSQSAVISRQRHCVSFCHQSLRGSCLNDCTLKVSVDVYRSYMI